MAIQELTLHQVNSELEKCIQDCLDCGSICLNTITYCIQKGGQHTTANHIKQMMDCAEICQTSANFMLRGSNFDTRTCAVCAEICEQCAQSCEQFDDDDQMQACAQMCRRCAESCRQMSTVAA